jgi:hypothetical protein
MAPITVRTIDKVLSSELKTSLVAEEVVLLALIADEIEWVAGCRLAPGPRPWPRRHCIGAGMSSLPGEIGQVCGRQGVQEYPK